MWLADLSAFLSFFQLPRNRHMASQTSLSVAMLETSNYYLANCLICRYRITASTTVFQTVSVGSIPTTCSIARIGPAHFTPRMEPTSSRISERVGNLKVCMDVKDFYPRSRRELDPYEVKSDNTRWAEEKL